MQTSLTDAWVFPEGQSGNFCAVMGPCGYCTSLEAFTATQAAGRLRVGPMATPLHPTTFDIVEVVHCQTLHQCSTLPIEAAFRISCRVQGSMGSVTHLKRKREFTYELAQ